MRVGEPAAKRMRRDTAPDRSIVGNETVSAAAISAVSAVPTIMAGFGYLETEGIGCAANR